MCCINSIQVTFIQDNTLRTIIGTSRELRFNKIRKISLIIIVSTMLTQAFPQPFARISKIMSRHIRNVAL